MVGVGGDAELTGEGLEEMKSLGLLFLLEYQKGCFCLFFFS